MALELNAKQPTRKAFEEFNGPNVNKMPELLKDNRIPLSFAWIMKQRLSAGKDLPDWYNYFDTSDLILYSKGDKVKFVLTVDAQGNITKPGMYALNLINPNENRDDGAIVLTDEAYDAIKGPGVIEMKRINLGILETWLDQRQILGHGTWRILVRHPDEVPKEFAEQKGLLNDYIQLVQSVTGDDKYMAVYANYNNKDHPKLRAWSANWLNGGLRSYAGGWARLDDDGSRFVGLAPEALSVLGKSPRIVVHRKGGGCVEQILEDAGQKSAFAPDQIRKFQYILEERPEN